MGKTGWSNQFKDLPNQSKFHKTLQLIFQTVEPFKNMHCWQEIAVKELVPGYRHDHRYDWYIEELNLIVELHGKQHYEIVHFGKEDFYQSKRNFNRSQFRDELKKDSAIEAGYSFLEIPYTVKDIHKYLLESI